MKKIQVLALGFLFSLIGIVSAHTGGDDYSHHMMMGYGIFGMTWLGTVISLLVIAVLILLIILISRKIRENEKKQKKK